VRVLFLTKYTVTGPSSRYRVAQFLPWVAARDIAYDLQSLHDDGYLARRYAGRGMAAGYLAARFAARAATLARARDYDLVFVQKEVFPHAPDLAERWLNALRVPYILDVDDAIHLFYDGATGWKRALRGKMERVYAGAALVLAGNQHLAEYARRFTPRVVHFPTVVDTDRFLPGNARGGGNPVTVGWIGTPETVRYLNAATPALASAAREAPFHLRVVGADAPRVEGVTAESRPWSEATEVSDLQAMDIGLMPLPDDAWAMGKCSLKLLQYMSSGLASVSSPIGSAADILARDPEGAGLLARDESEWRRHLAALVRDPALRTATGARARRVVETHYSLARWAPRFVDALDAAVAGKVPVFDD